MKNWLNKNYKILIILAFLIPIVIVAVVSISHVTVWYGISNPLSWAMYLSLGVEIAALSALAAISASMGRSVYFPFIIVTIIQFIGNIFFSYQFIDINSKIFKDWVDLVTPLLSAMGVEEGDMVGHRRFLAVFSGGLLPLISLSFLHMLVKFSEDARLKKHNIINDDNGLVKTKDEIENNTSSIVITENNSIETITNLNDELELPVLEPKEIIKKEDDEQKKIEETYDSSTEEGYVVEDVNDFVIEESIQEPIPESIEVTSTVVEQPSLFENQITESTEEKEVDEKQEQQEKQIPEEMETQKSNFNINDVTSYEDVQKKN